MMRVVDWRVFWGGNPYAPPRSVLCALEVPSDPWPLEKALVLMQQAYPHWLPVDMPGETLPKKAAWAVACWAQAALNEERGYITGYGCVTEPSLEAVGGEDPWIWVHVGFHRPDLTQQALELAVRVLNAASGAENSIHQVERLRCEVDAQMSEFYQRCIWYHPDYQACILMQAAEHADIPVLPFSPEGRVWQFGWGNRSRLFFETASNHDGLAGFVISHNKVFSKDALRALGVPTPAHVLVHEASQLAQAVKQVGWPCVVKPLDQGGGRGVTAGVTNMAALEQAFDWARQYTSVPWVMVEQFCAGADHRLYLVNGELMAAVVREPPSVQGDGRSTVQQLIDGLNQERSSKFKRDRHLAPLAIDEAVHAQLQAQKVTLDQVLPFGKTVILRSNANRSTGGTAKDVTALVHPEIRTFAARVAKALGMYAAGFDLMTTDISRPPSETGAQVIEINHTPGLRVLLAAGFDPVELGCQLLGPDLGRVQAELRVVEPSALTLERQALQRTHHQPGDAWVVASDIGVQGQVRQVADPAPWAAVMQALHDPATRNLVVVCTTQSLYQWGLPIDRYDRLVLKIQSIDAAWLQALQKAVRPAVPAV